MSRELLIRCSRRIPLRIILIAIFSIILIERLNITITFYLVESSAYASIKALVVINLIVVIVLIVIT